MRGGCRGLAATGLTLVAALFVAPGAALAGTLDQQQTGVMFNQPIQAVPPPASAAQTFTPGISGKLDQVDLFSAQTGIPDQVLRVEIRGTTGGVIDDTALASSAIGDLSATLSWVPVVFPAPASVQAGTLYAIIVYTMSTQPGSGYTWAYDHPTDYLGGQMFTSTGGLPPTGIGFAPVTGSADTAFRTYVQAPPTGGGSGGAATGQRAAALKKCRKKHSKKAKKKCKKKANRLPI
jgi:hypothetical protein